MKMGGLKQTLRDHPIIRYGPGNVQRFLGKHSSFHREFPGKDLENSGVLTQKKLISDELSLL